MRSSSSSARVATAQRILEVSSDATAEQIREAYRRAAMRYHPDRPGGSADLFHAVAEAYKVLSEPPVCSECKGTGYTMVRRGFFLMKEPCKQCSK